MNDINEMKSYIKKGEWDLIHSIVSSSNFSCKKSALLLNLIRIPDAITEEVYQTIKIIHKPTSRSDWIRLLMKIHPPFEKLKYFLENKIIFPNDNVRCHTDDDACYTVMQHYLWGPFQWKTKFDFFLSEDMGGNINIQDDQGNTLLHSILRCHYSKERQNQNPEFYENYLEKVMYFLEAGADPLLENKKGITPIDYVRQRPTELNSIRDELLHLLEAYA